jgi:hypothetical protein
MKTIAVLAQKGGSGKTTLSECLAVAAELDGKSAAILDMDPQGTADSWKKRRGSDDPAVKSVTMSSLSEELDHIRAAGADFLLALLVIRGGRAEGEDRGVGRLREGVSVSNGAAHALADLGEPVVPDR